MRAAPRIPDSDRAAPHGGGTPGDIAPGVLVTLRRPWRLRGTTAVVRRRVLRGWEVEFRSPLGTPMHLVLPARALRRA